MLSKSQKIRIKEKFYSSQEGVSDFCELINTNYQSLQEAGVDFDDIYGCGSFGCAFGTDDPYITAKITDDYQEMNFYYFSQDYYNPILPSIFYILELKVREDNQPYYLVLREAVEPLSKIPDLDEETVGLIEDYVHDNLRIIKDEIQVSDDPLVRHLRFYYQDYIGDVHYNNVGLSKLDGRPILFDAQMIIVNRSEFFRRRK